MTRSVFFQHFKPSNLTLLSYCVVSNFADNKACQLKEQRVRLVYRRVLGSDNSIMTLLLLSSQPPVKWRCIQYSTTTSSYFVAYPPPPRRILRFNRRQTNSATEKMSKNKNQLDATYYFIVLLISSTCFGYYYAHHEELATPTYSKPRTKRPMW